MVMIKIKANHELKIGNQEKKKKEKVSSKKKEKQIHYAIEGKPI